MKTLDAAVFDFDGTLVDGLDAIVECFHLAFDKFQLAAPSKDEIRKRIGLPLYDIYTAFLPPEHHKNINSVMEAYRSVAVDILPAKTYLRPGVAETLDTLKTSGIKLGIATTKGTATTLKTIEHLKIAHLFDMVCGIDMVKNPKPDPEQLLLVIERLKTIPEKAVMVGDTYVDVKAAKAAGMISAAVLDGFGEKKLIEDASPDFMLETIADLMKSGLIFGRFN